MPPHAHGGGEEEEVIIVRTDGPPFYDIKAKQGKGFEVDYERVAKFLGPGKISLADFTHDLNLINNAYVPTAHASYAWLQRGVMGMGGSFVSFIIMGIVGEDFGVTADVRGIIVPLIFLMFLVGLLCFLYSKFIEQPGIKDGSVLVKKILDEQINPRHVNSTARVRYTIRVSIQKKSSIHLGQTFVERPVVTIWALRSENEQGVLTDWVLPSALSQGGLVTTKSAEGEDTTKGSPHASATPGGSAGPTKGQGRGIRKVVGGSTRKAGPAGKGNQQGGA